MSMFKCTNSHFVGFGKYRKCRNKAVAVFRDAEGKRRYACKGCGGLAFVASGTAQVPVSPR